MDGGPAAGMGDMGGNNDKIDTLIDFPIKGFKLNKFVKNKELPHETIIAQENIPFYIFFKGCFSQKLKEDRDCLLKNCFA